MLDTDTCVHILRGNHRVIAQREATSDDVATTWITAAELQYGAAKSIAPEQNREIVARLLATMPILGIDDESARLFGETKAQLEAAGMRLADADLLIGAIAVAHGAILVTGNERHFQRIQRLIIENWIR
ncbi:MAG: type II toxin-antitoxin system VapC family toxin [Byssovorax sp.]